MSIEDRLSSYRLSGQIGFNLRRANQRHVAIFTKHVEGLTPTQFAVLAKLYENGALSQNLLGRETAMDSATIKGVVGRLKSKGLVHSRPDMNDQRLRLVELTEDGQAVFAEALPKALVARQETISRLTEDDIAKLEELLGKLV